MIEKRVREAIARHGMIEHGDRVVVAVSGGVDSVVLLWILSRMASEFDLSLSIAHLDHRLRPSAGEDARFVEDLGVRLQVPVVSERIDVREFARSRRLGLEEAAREARRTFLDRVALEAGANRIALGHTADDQAETILFRLARGTGIEGLRGMAPASGRYVRPLLYVARAEVLAYAQEWKLSWREDETNSDVALSRNRIRHRILPELARINPGVIEALQRTADLADEAADATAFLVQHLWTGVRTEEADGRVGLSRSAVRALPEGVQAIILREAMRRVRRDLDGIDRAHVVAARRLIASSRERGALDLPRAQLRVAADDVVLSREEAAPTLPVAWSRPLALGFTSLPEQGLDVDLTIAAAQEWSDPSQAQDRWAEAADADRVLFPLHLRTRRRGDRFAPLGMDGDVRLKDFLINQNVPCTERWRLPLLCDRERIVWVAGVRLSEYVKVRRSTERILHMRIQRRDA